MSGRQRDLFSGAGFRADDPTPTVVDRPRLTPAVLDDDALITAIPGASLADCHGLAMEAGRRRLAGAVPALEALCRRFKGFGTEHAIPEQTAALEGLAAIGGREAADTVARIILEGVVQGPGLTHAVAVAARLGARVPHDLMVSLLRHPSPDIRANACRYARLWPEVVGLLAELLSDLNDVVATAAACALGRLGRIEGRPAHTRLLRERPSIEVIDAVTAVADVECLVLLGRVARSRPDLADAALAALDDIDEPRAATIASAIRRSYLSLRGSRSALL